MSVIDSLSAGYRFLGRRIELLLIPVLIDFAIWFLPRLTLGSLFAQIADFYRSSAALEGVPADLAEMSAQVSEVITDLGGVINLTTMLANQALLHVPSLMRVMGAMPNQAVEDLSSPLTIVGVYLGLGALGLLLGVIFLNMLAQRLPLGQATKAQSLGEFSRKAGRDWLKVIGFVALIALVMGGIYLVVSVLLGLVALFVPALSSVLALLLGGFSFVAFIFLYFVTVAIVLDDLPIFTAVRQSFSVVRHNFGATLFFVLLTNLISVGFSVILTRLGATVPLGTVAAILINAYIGVGLAMALMVFYRSRWLKLSGEKDPDFDHGLRDQQIDQRPKAVERTNYRNTNLTKAVTA